MRYMGEQVAWRLLDLVFSGELEWKGDKPRGRFLWYTFPGLCGALGKLRKLGLISLRTQVKMRSRYARRRNWSDTQFKWSQDVDGMRARSRFCRRQARLR